MAQLIPFAYCPGRSIFHMLDVRMKLFSLCLISICLVRSDLLACILYFLILNSCFYISKANPYRILWRMKLFLVLLGFVFISRSLTTPGEELFSIFTLSVTQQGLFTGLLVSLKFFLVMMTGLLFCTTTRTSQVKSAVQWVLKPVPFIPEKRVAVMVSLTLAFMPVILKQAQAISDAQAARCGNLEKNPVKKITRLILPMLKKTFLTADNMILAMESRCYGEDRTDPVFSPSGREPLFFLGSGVMAVTLFLF